MFKGGVYSKVGREIKNCINQGIIIFRIILPVLTTSDFDYIRAATLIRGRRLFENFFLPNAAFIPGSVLIQENTVWRFMYKLPEISVT